MPGDDDRMTDGGAGKAIRRALAPPALDPSVRSRLLLRAEPELRRRRRAPRIWRAGANAALAAAVLLTVGATLYFGWFAKSGGSRSRALTADINADGLVDILDAHALARAVDAGRGGADLNSDGAITRSDADWLADRVVRLGGAG